MQKRKKTYILEIRLVSDICDTLTDNMYTLGVTEKCMFRKIAYRWFSKEFSAPWSSGLGHRPFTAITSSSNLAGVIMQVWWNGRHAGLRNQCLTACGFDSHYLYFIFAGMAE